MKMWNNVKARHPALKLLQGVRSFCTRGTTFLRLWGAKPRSCGHRRCRFTSEESCQLAIRQYSSSGPPWRVLFFGSDGFAVESLKLLTAVRASNERIVDSLEVVVLSNNILVRKFADQHHLPLHTWPPGDLRGRFDVAVVVSFGCLLQEKLISQFPYGILNVHPSLLPRWRGPAPIFHTILHGDTVTGVTIMQIKPQRFDVGPILNQEVYAVPQHCTADQLGVTLAARGANLLIDTLRTLPEKLANKKEQSQTGATSAPKISTSMSWVAWEEQTCDQIDRLFRAIGSRIPLRTMWMGKPIKLLDFIGKCHISLSGRGTQQIPGSISFLKATNILAVCCKDGWVGFKAVVLKKQLTAEDFYNGYLHPGLKEKTPHQTPQHLFVTGRNEARALAERENSGTQ